MKLQYFDKKYCLFIAISFYLKISSVARGDAMGHLHPPSLDGLVLDIPGNGVLAFYNQNVNINEAFKLKLSNCTPKPNFWLRHCSILCAKILCVNKGPYDLYF